MGKKKQRRTGFSPSWILIGLVVLTFAVFGQLASHEFLNYDDGQFVTENAHVHNGDVLWAFTSAELGWYPLTWLSHMLDVRLWGLEAGRHLLMNVLLHALNACLLFLALRRMTDALWPSAFIAALFAIHPMHVESVAWVSERKDTLSTLFVMLALFVYSRDPRRRVALFVLMACSLMAKQMYVTLPLILLLVDYWPLGRLSRAAVIEKLPLFALSIAGAAIAAIGQRNLGTFKSVPLDERLANAAVAVVRYIVKLFVPSDLAVLYPLQPVSIVVALAALIVIVAITAAVIRFRHIAPYAVTGWLWFLITLLPVIGIVQIGPQAMADRYSYFSYIGLFIIIAFGLRGFAPALAIIAVGVLALFAWRQAGYWRTSETLFEHEIAVAAPHPLPEYLLGQTLEMRDPERAIPHFRRAIALETQMKTAGNAWLAEAYVGLATARLAEVQSIPSPGDRIRVIWDSIGDLQRALALDPNAPHAKNNLAVAQQWIQSAGSPIARRTQ